MHRTSLFAVTAISLISTGLIAGAIGIPASRAKDPNTPAVRFDADVQWQRRLDDSGLKLQPVSEYTDIAVCGVVIRQNQRGRAIFQPAMIVRNDGTKCSLSSPNLTGETSIGTFTWPAGKMRSQELSSAWSPTPPDDSVTLPAYSDVLILFTGLPPEIYKSESFVEASKTITQDSTLVVRSSRLNLRIDSVEAEVNQLRWVVVPQEVCSLTPYTY